jgi:adapter protein MecA 1/2
MKIEKVNDNQIKCTLNKSDLASRQIKLSELAYGTEKAKSLFKDMMQQASAELGFDAEDIPLMIEAIPVSSDCIVLLITKVEDPEELDTRFSKFAPSPDDMEEIDADSSAPQASAGLLDMINQVKNELKSELKNSDDKHNSSFIPLPEALSKNDPISKKSTASKISYSPESPSTNGTENDAKTNIIKIFSFNNIDTIIDVSGILKEMYNGVNSLYKSPLNNRFYLVVTKSNHSIEDFNRVCNILLEYGSLERGSKASEAFYQEHFTKIITRRALQKLTSVKAY